MEAQTAMKYPFRKVENIIVKGSHHGKPVYRIKTIEVVRSKKYGSKTECRYHFDPFDTLEEAEEWLKKVDKVNPLATNMLSVSSGMFIRYYGCTYCADALDRNLEPISDQDDDYIRVRFCPHKKCPYAEQIESYDGFHNLLAEQEKESPFCFSDLFRNVEYFL